MADIESQKHEAIERMKMLKLHDNVIREFKNKGKLNLSEPNGALYWLNNDQKKRVSEFEERYDAVVYHVIHSITTFGELLSYLYVSDDKDEWELDKEDIIHGTALAYVDNLDNEYNSEFGSIGIQPLFGGVIRTK